MTVIQQQIACSPYLTRLAEQVEEQVDTSPDSLLGQLEKLISGLVVDHFSDLDATEQRLVEINQEFSYLWCLTELQGVGSQHQRGGLQTRFAEVSIQFALGLAWQRLANKQKLLGPILENNAYSVPGLFIFGMGKLGGNDLNFSSDVDLVAYFDPEVLPIPDVIGKSYVCHQALQEFTRILSRGGASDFIWRVDWRLRPNASATSLAMSTAAAEDYYYYHASPWHRLALMKARVIAGDTSLGQAFISTLGSFIWRQNLDFRALDELAEIKQRINLEHPGLRAQRTWSKPIGDDIEGFNVKLGSGGIREIEFFVNAQQLLLGGRHHSLRVPNTLLALDQLCELGRLDREDLEKLKGAYVFLRKLENAVQIHSNQQTHLLPVSDTNKSDVLTLLAIEDWSRLVEQLNVYRGFVNQFFSTLFAEQERTQLGPLVWPDGLSLSADEVVEGWENGFQNYGVSNSVRHKLKPLAYALAEYLDEGADHSGPDVSEVIIRLHDYFKSLPQGEQYFRLLAESPGLLHSLVPPLLYSPPMTVLLNQSPHIIDCYVHGEWRYPDAFDSQYIRQAEDYGERLERLRRFVNEHLYQLYQQFLRGQLDVVVFQAALSDLAEHTLELALEVVATGMNLEEVPITVIGMGKIALKRMSPMSDLDLIFIYDPEHTTLDLASRFVSRLQTAIASPMREGILYELDTRLRPSGRSGAPTVSVDSFANHHSTRAHTWEHIALMPSQIVAGRRQIEAKFRGIKHELIVRNRDVDQFKKDARKMWERVIEHRVGDAPLTMMNSKLRVGGLMQAEYLVACLVIDYGAKFTTKSTQLDDLLNECLPHYGLEELPEIIQFWRVQQLWERLLGKTDQALSSLRDSYFARLLEHSSCTSMDELLAKKKRYADYVVEGMTQFFAQSLDLTDEELEDWQETSVTWQ